MQHLYNSCVQVYRLRKSASAPGRAAYDYVALSAPLNRLPGRFDLQFVRPGKDQPRPVEAGKAPDRMGLWFCDPDTGIKAGDILVSVLNDEGRIPVVGSFEIKAVPDEAQDFGSTHHIEVQVVEVAQPLGNFGEG